MIYWIRLDQAKRITDGAKASMAMDCIYYAGLSLTKMSVVLFYVRIFGSVKLYRIAFWLVGSLVVGWYVAFNFVALFVCVPVQKSWEPDLKGHCVSGPGAFVGTAASNIAIDGFILILPMPMLWRLHMDVRERLALIGLFAAGYW